MQRNEALSITVGGVFTRYYFDTSTDLPLHLDSGVSKNLDRTHACAIYDFPVSNSRVILIDEKLKSRVMIKVELVDIMSS
jgi:hypothetical protein